MNKKFSLIIVAIIVAVAIAAIIITIIENNPIEINNAPTPDSWTRCAMEWGNCHLPVPVPQTVKYGFGTQWFTKDITSADGTLIPCNSTEFNGDPSPGNTKECYYSEATPTDPSWVKCATQHGTCSVDRNSMVRYGDGNQWVYGVTHTGSIECNNNTFGDPSRSKDKNCYYPAAEPAAPWTKCATQHGKCSFEGHSEIVRYGGEDGNWVYGTFTSSVDCNNAQFGDPSPGNDKNCYNQGAEPTGPWTKCSTQYGTCTPGIHPSTVRYGGDDGNWVYGIFRSEVSCNNTEFGDPSPGNDKNCYYQAATPTGPWSICVTEANPCPIVGSKTIRYGGANGNWIYGTFNGEVQCNNAQFGDPSPGNLKACYIERTTPFPGPWTLCAIEGGECNLFNKTDQVVRYGDGTHWVYKTVNGNVSCVVSVFGDPVPGNTNECYYQGDAPTGPWTKCANDGSMCTSNDPGAMGVKYGTTSEWVYGIVDQTIRCSDVTFGPVPGEDKLCFSNRMN